MSCAVVMCVKCLIFFESKNDLLDHQKLEHRDLREVAEESRRKTRSGGGAKQIETRQKSTNFIVNKSIVTSDGHTIHLSLGNQMSIESSSTDKNNSQVSDLKKRTVEQVQAKKLAQIKSLGDDIDTVKNTQIVANKETLAQVKHAIDDTLIVNNINGVQNSIEDDGPNQEELCRTCARRQRYVIPIDSNLGREKQLLQKMSLLIEGIGTKEDRLPMYICLKCLSKLEETYQFMLQIVYAEIILEDIIPKDIKPVAVDSSQTCDNPIDKLAAYKNAFKNKSLVIGLVADRNTVMAEKNNSTRRRGKRRKIQEGRRSSNDYTESEKVDASNASDDTVSPAPVTSNSRRNSIFSVMNEETMNISKIFQLQDVRDNRIECNFCFQRFSDEVAMRRHEVVHEKKFTVFPKLQSITCQYCFMVCDTQKDLQLHQANKHRADNELCERCGKMVKRINYHRWRYHSPFECSLCNSVFSDESTLRNHWESRHCEADEMYKKKKKIKCLDCDEMILKSFYYHHLNCHRSNLFYTCSDCGEAFKNKRTLECHFIYHTNLLNCPYCNRMFPDQRSVITHMMQANNEECSCARNNDESLIDNSSKENSLAARIMAHGELQQSEPSDEALQSRLTFGDNSQWDVNQMSHLVESMGEVEVTTDNTQSNMSKSKKSLHIKEICFHETLINCTGCKKNLRSVEEEQTEERIPAKCLCCDKIFKSVWYMRAHIIRKHSETARAKCYQTKYQCQYCKTIFPRVSKRNSHLAFAHPKQAWLGHCCNLCLFQTKHLFVLRWHMRTHVRSNYKCRLCLAKS